MNIELPRELIDFRTEVRAFIEERLPEDLREKVRRSLGLVKDDYLRWQDILAARGWLAYTWPAEHGGPGWSPLKCYLFEEEMGRACAPRPIPFGVKMLGPVIYTFGSDAQKAKYLPAIAANETWWCQGYSEPNAGSDLARLGMRAVRQGDHYIVNGSKTWTTTAQWADRMFCLVRTDPAAKRQEGISFLLVDMKEPGIEVVPIATFDGGREINSVHVRDVRVPAEDLVGEENRGWTYAKFLLGLERFGIAGIAASKARLAYLEDIVREGRGGEASLAGDRDLARSIAETEIELRALERTELRALMRAERGESPGVEANVLKIRGTELQQRISELLMVALGVYASPFLPGTMEPGRNEAPVGPDHAPGLAPAYFNMRKTSIYGGTNEIQRNIIAKMALGL